VRKEPVEFTLADELPVALDANIYRSRVLVANRESDGSHRDIRSDMPWKTAKPLDLS
jgi:hypothetical protein